MDLSETNYIWARIHLTQYKVILANTIMSLHVPQKEGNFFVS
jgi:hypothetical protein